MFARLLISIGTQKTIKIIQKQNNLKEKINNSLINFFVNDCY